MLCQDLLVHHTRRAVSTSRDLCDHFLSSSCSSPSTERIKAVSRILQFILPFCRDGSGVENASRAIQSRAILYRLDHNSQGGWDHFDAALQEYLMGPVCTATDLVPVIDSILSEELPNAFQVCLTPTLVVRISHLLTPRMLPCRILESVHGHTMRKLCKHLRSD